MSDIREPVSWGKSTATEAVLEQLAADRLLQMNVSPERPAWIAPRPEDTEPNPPEGYVVSLVRLHERGFGVPVSRFMRALCEYYGAELHNFGPNSILQAAVFVAVCEGYLGIEAHWDLWIHLFHGELFVENVRGQPKRFARAVGLMLHLRPSRKNLYIPNKMTMNNAGWARGWFYLRNFSNKLPAFTNKVLRERPAKWDWGGVAPRAPSQARGPHRGAGAPGEEGVDGGCRHRELPPAEGDSSHGEEPANFRPHPRGPVRGLEDVERAAPPGRCCPEGEEYGGGVPRQPR